MTGSGRPSRRVQAELAESGDGLDSDPLSVVLRPGRKRNRRSRRRIETASPAARRRSDLAIAAAVGRVDQVVQAQVRSVDPELRVPLAEAGQHDALSPRPARRRHDLGRTRCSGAAVTSTPPKHGRRRSEMAARRRRRSRAHIGRRRRGPPAAGSVPRSCNRIVDHLGDVEPPVLVPGDRHGAGHLGLGRRPARSSAPGRPARTPPAPREADAGVDRGLVPGSPPGTRGETGPYHERNDGDVDSWVHRIIRRVRIQGRAPWERACSASVRSRAAGAPGNRSSASGRPGR